LRWRLFGLALAYHALGRNQQSEAKPGGADREVLQGQPLSGCRGVRVPRGDEPGVQWLERAYTEPDSALREIKSEPLLNNLRRDARYSALLKKMGLPL
jgi:hypothetical protein